MSDLFGKTLDKKKNLLPKDGIVNYHGNLLSPKEASYYLEILLKTIAWRNDETIIFGKRIITKREVAWYGDKAFEYTYSKTTKTALPWTRELQDLKKIIEQETGEVFNSCLLNLYHNGEEGMGWHSDAESDLKRDSAIGSLSLGAERKFVFRHKETKEKVAIVLEHGSLLMMKGNTQKHWMHSLPVTKRIKHPRVNLTFRSIVE